MDVASIQRGAVTQPQRDKTEIDATNFKSKCKHVGLAAAKQSRQEPLTGQGV